MTGFRCSAASVADDEELAGTAPTDVRWLCVEHAGPWGRKALTDSRLPDPVVDRLRAYEVAGVRVQLIRRPGGKPSSPDGVRLFAFDFTDGPVLRSTLLPSLDDVVELDRVDDWPTYEAPLWLVCTNGRRDICCAELGRPVAAALAHRWPEATWETTHLGGHRFAATLLAPRAGVALGRVDPSAAVAACAELETGRVPLDVSRGRVGWPAPAQWAELHVRRQHGWSAPDQVSLVEVDHDAVHLSTPDGEMTVQVVAEEREPQRLSCADEVRKPRTRFVLRG